MERTPDDTQRDASDAVSAAETQSFVRHELRAPLAVIQPVLGMLLDETAGPVSERQSGYLRMLERNTARLAGMIASVVESGWLEVAAIPPSLERVGVGDLVRATVEDVRAALESPPRLEVHVSDGAPCVQGDAFRLGRAVRNVVLNACLYTAPGGRVDVRAEAGAGSERAVIVVEDSGQGVAPDELPRVFEPGYRGEAGRSGAAQGLGLGLPVAQAIIREHGGAIVLESAEGRGTRVSIELPAVLA